MTQTLSKGKTFILTLAAVVLLAGIGGQAEAGKKKNKHDKDDDDKVSQSLCPRGVFGDYADASGRWVTYQTADPVQVCDRTTGKFWEQSPSTDKFVWSSAEGTPNAMAHCAELGPGWRLPEVQELVGVVDYSTKEPAVNTSVFSNIRSNHYWSATTSDFNFGDAWDVDFRAGHVSVISKLEPQLVWCVRSGS